MPPAKKRTRRYDPAKTRAAVLAQFGHVADAVRTLTPEQLGRPTRLGDWTVRELAVHLTMALGVLERRLAEPEPLKQELALLDWPSATAGAAGQIADDTRELAARVGDLDALYAERSARAAELLRTTADERLVPTRFGAMAFGDVLVTRLVELTVHTDDLNDALPELAVPHDRQALAASTRLLADALALKAPGGSVEVRIPPYAVVQCVAGPKHTRGTPPNVVETDPLTWVRLATGRVGWGGALDAARVAASGDRADVSHALPLLT
ncbi:maleylpyruvate isomerase family mycothiol-dependent enzyme [Streptomyces sp. NBC_00083]|uniref:maleylpyruvate isomerase family mycothiol-dependent enzyme n=1 Tax=Streptomyces sp. NBC_00083 TaxID=2975647 RepID=UPI00224E0F08|nr:maleylpyruvate isomerase family mycothiol-dependent enzyme [Streptomyces sp. NBC_00083]MCX5387724.1 maleylpyruvate isomerase family mycothiol-dependent enzyme [Streptomyces sp. NBC_00083]